MTELMKVIQSSNEAFKSDLLKSFITDHKGQLSQSPGDTQDYVDSPGAGFFVQSSSPSSQLAPSTASTTNTATSPTGTDNANANVLIQESRTDNVPTSDNGNITESNQNTINANLTTTTSGADTTTTTTTTASGEGPDTNANQSDVAAVLEKIRGESPSETRQLLVQQVTEATVEAHEATCLNTHRAVQEARARFMAAKEAGQLPDLSKLSLSASAMWEKMTGQIMPEMDKTIKFFRLLPGFTELCLDDQMLLIKQGMFEVMMTRFSMLIDSEKDTMMDPSHNMLCPRQVIQEMPMGQFLDSFFQVGARFNPIGLRDSEIGVFTAVLAFSPSRAGLKEPRLVATIQSLYLRALFALVKQNHSDPDSKFSQALGLAPMFRHMNEAHSKALGAMKMKSTEAFDQQFPPLHREICANTDQ